jgi:hypothetical protein
MLVTGVPELEKALKTLVDAGREYDRKIKDSSGKGPSKKEDKGKKDYLKGIDVYYARIKQAIKEINKFVGTNKGWNEQKNKAVKDLIGTLKLILTITNSETRYLYYTTPKEEPERSDTIGRIKKLERLAEGLDDTIDNLELITQFYNKERGNDLEIALSRLKDKDDPVITSNELRKLLGL